MLSYDRRIIRGCVIRKDRAGGYPPGRHCHQCRDRGEAGRPGDRLSECSVIWRRFQRRRPGRRDTDRLYYYRQPEQRDKGGPDGVRIQGHFIGSVRGDAAEM